MAPPLGVTPFEFCRDLLQQKTRVPAAIVRRCLCDRFTVSVEHRLVTRQTYDDGIYRAIAWRRAVKTVEIARIALQNRQDGYTFQILNLGLPYASFTNIGDIWRGTVNLSFAPADQISLGRYIVSCLRGHAVTLNLIHCFGPPIPTPSRIRDRFGVRSSEPPMCSYAKFQLGRCIVSPAGRNTANSTKF